MDTPEKKGFAEDSLITPLQGAEIEDTLHASLAPTIVLKEIVDEVDSGQPDSFGDTEGHGDSMDDLDSEEELQRADDNGGDLEDGEGFPEDGRESEGEHASEAAEEIHDEPPPQERRRGPEVNSVQELIATLPTWARNHAQLLRSHLTGVIALVTTDPHRSYRIDWSGDRLVAEAGDAPTADCRVVLSQGDVMRVVRGELNPQIGMLSGRIKASGNPEMAMYLFNLIVRR